MISPAVGYQGQVPMPLPAYGNVWVPPLFPGGQAPWARPRKWLAAVAYVNSTFANWSGTTGAINVPAGTSNGHLMFLSVASAGSTGWAVTGGGWVQIYGINQNQLVWYRIASSEPASYTLTWAGSGTAGGTMTVFSGQDSDPFLAYKNRTGGGANGAETSPNHSTSPLFFQACDFMAFSTITHRNSGTITAPSGWSAGTQGTNSVKSASAYRSFTNTEGLAATNWTDTAGSHLTDVFTCAIRPSGVTALSLKATIGTAALTNQTSFSASLPVGVAVGDLIVVHHFIRDPNPSTARTLSASGYTLVGSQQNMTAGTLLVASAMYRRIATGSDALTCASTLSCDNQCALVVVFSTGSAGVDPVLLGTPGQSVDSSANTTNDVPSMTLADYAENNILVAFTTINWNGVTSLSAPAGFSGVTHTANTANPGRSWWEGGAMAAMAAAKMNGAANPGATSFTSNVSATSQGYQYAVGLSLEGAGQPEVSSYIFG